MQLGNVRVAAPVVRERGESAPATSRDLNGVNSDDDDEDQDYHDNDFDNGAGKETYPLWVLWGKPPDRGDTTPRPEPGTGREQSRNTPLGG